MTSVLPRAAPAASLLALFALLATLPLWMPSLYYVNVASQILFWAVLALGLNVLVGYGGLVSLGHAGLFGFAGYTAALLLAAGHGHAVAIPAAILGAVLMAAVFGFLALRST